MNFTLKNQTLLDDIASYNVNPKKKPIDFYSKEKIFTFVVKKKIYARFRAFKDHNNHVNILENTIFTKKLFDEGGFCSPTDITSTYLQKEGTNMLDRYTRYEDSDVSMLFEDYWFVKNVIIKDFNNILAIIEETDTGYIKLIEYGLDGTDCEKDGSSSQINLKLIMSGVSATLTCGKNYFNIEINFKHEDDVYDGISLPPTNSIIFERRNQEVLDIYYAKVKQFREANEEAQKDWDTGGDFSYYYSRPILEDIFPIFLDNEDIEEEKVKWELVQMIIRIWDEMNIPNCCVDLQTKILMYLDLGDLKKILTKFLENCRPLKKLFSGEDDDSIYYIDADDDWGNAKKDFVYYSIYKKI